MIAVIMIFKLMITVIMIFKLTIADIIISKVMIACSYNTYIDDNSHNDI